jgi:predicted alpha/beta hydrolase family esterase
MKTIITILSTAILAGMPQERVMYVPGWHRCQRGADEAFRAVQKAFPEAEVSVRNWDGNCHWKKARTNADAEAARLAVELMSMPEDSLSQLTLVGHSLGARIVVKALAKLAVEGKKVKTAVILAAAMPSNDPDVMNFTAATIEPATIVCNSKDTMLKYGYRPFGGEKAQALGLNGPSAKPDNCRVMLVSPETTLSTPLTALWAKIGWFRMIAAHYAPFYLEQLKRSR